MSLEQKKANKSGNLSNKEYPLRSGLPSLLRLCESKRKAVSLPQGITAMHSPVMNKIEPVLTVGWLERQ